MRRLLVPFLLCALVWDVSLGTQPPPPQEVELLRLTQQSTWTPENEFHKISLRLGALGQVSVLQACSKQTRRSVLSEWTERGEASHLLLDIMFVQEEETSGQPGPLQVHLLDSDFSRTRLSERREGLNLNASQPFPSSISQPAQMLQYLSNRTALPLGPLTHKGFQLGLSYTGTCVLVFSIRVYYRRCPHMLQALSAFSATAAGSGEVRGSCVPGAVEMVPPVRECSVEGVWGPQQGQCVCAPGHQPVTDSCQACGIGFYRAANQSEGCQRCPPHSETHSEGSDKCDCVSGFSRLHTDPPDLGCTRPPSAPVNMTVHHYNDFGLILSWDAPLDWGGRLEMSYRVHCERRGQDGGQWKTCDDGEIFLPDAKNLTSTSVNLTGLSPYEDYRLSVQARNGMKGALYLSTATLTIQRLRAPPVVMIINITQNPEVVAHVAVSQSQRRLFLWITVGVLSAVLLLLAVVPIGVRIFQRTYSKLRSEQEMELLPIHPGISYTRPQQAEVSPQQGNQAHEAGGDSVLQMLQGLGERLADSLKEVLVERHQLTLGKELGKGEFGSVYEAVFSRNGEDLKVAVKTMRVGFHSQEDLHEFLREAEIMKNFDHDSVVRLLGVTLQREQDSSVPVPLVILPYMKHRDLRRFLIATRYGDIPMFVPYQTLLRFTVDIAEGMDYLSSQGFLHRDLAARNCMLGDDLRVCVADFGLSRKIYDSNYYRQKEAIRVPIKWMSIESLSESIYTTKSDVWSFGITMWEIVSRGRTPYPGVQNHELLDLLLMGHRLKAPDDCDPKLWVSAVRGGSLIYLPLNFTRNQK